MPEKLPFAYQIVRFWHSCLVENLLPIQVQGDFDVLAMSQGGLYSRAVGNSRQESEHSWQRHGSREEPN